MPLPYLDRTSPELFSSDVFLGADVERMKSSSGQERGAIFTRLEVVCFILDLPDTSLTQLSRYPVSQ